LENHSIKILFRIILFVSILHSSLIFSKGNLDVIVIDAGHGGKDPGTLGDSGAKEKDITLPIALKLGDLIKQNFPTINVIYTRKTDVFVEVKDRTVIANNNKAKLFISIHVNHKKEDETEKNGFEIYLLNRDRFPEAIEITQKDNSKLRFQTTEKTDADNYIFSSLAETGYLRFAEFLSNNLMINLDNSTMLSSRGIMQAGFWVLLASMPSVLIETGYISDENDQKYLSSEEGQTNIARAIFQGFSNYKKYYEMDSN
jgi:N-acetylmuramoyl-L-alanine amidase